MLGSGVGVPNVKRSYPGLFIKSDEESILIDPGPGSLRQLVKLGFSYNDLDTIILTHFHPDHSLDVISFLFACKYPLLPRTKSLSIIGGPGLKRFYEGAIGVFGDAIVSEMFEVSLKEIKEDTIVRDKRELTIKPVVHTDSSIGIRYKDRDGKILCYSGDTGYCKNIIELARKADLLILECSFPDAGEINPIRKGPALTDRRFSNGVNGHLTPSYAGRIAREAEVKRLLVTHLYPVCEEYDILLQCKKEFGGETQIARDLMKIEL